MKEISSLKESKTTGERKGRAMPEVGAIHYQEFSQGKGVMKEVDKPGEETRSVNTNYVVYEIKRSDGSVLFLPII